MTTIADIRSDFALLDDWEDRYRYLIELGRALPPFPDALMSEANKVRGCASQVWLATQRAGDPARPAKSDRLGMQGTSDALIVKGLIAVLFALYAGKTLEEIPAIDAGAAFSELGLAEHLTPQRSNGFAAMVQRIRADAESLIAA